jgi:hypothetical protein
MTVCQENMPIGIAVKLADGPYHEWKMRITTAARPLARGKDFLQVELAVAEYGGKGMNHGNLR